MTREEAEKCANEMTYRDAVYNVIQAKCIPYRKATLIKLYELLNVLETLPPATPKHGICKDCASCYCYNDCETTRVCIEHGCMHVSANFYCKNFKKKGSENEAN